MANSAWPYQLLTPAGYALKITFFEKLYLPEGHKYNSHEFFWPWLLYWDSLPIYHIFWLITFRGASIKCQAWWKLAKTTGAMLEPMLSCSAWGVTEIDYAAFWGGSAKELCDGLLTPQESNYWYLQSLATVLVIHVVNWRKKYLSVVLWWKAYTGIAVQVVTRDGN